MSLSLDGVWKGGIWAPTVWKAGVWREGTPVPPTPPAPDQSQNSGGYEYARRAPRRRSAAEVRLERERLGILPAAAEVIDEVATRQAEAPALDAQQQLEELERELSLRAIAWQGRYLELLNAQRSRLVDEEIGVRLRALQDREEADLMVIFALAGEI